MLWRAKERTPNKEVVPSLYRVTWLALQDSRDVTASRAEYSGEQSVMPRGIDSFLILIRMGLPDHSYQYDWAFSIRFVMITLNPRAHVTTRAREQPSRPLGS